MVNKYSIRNLETIRKNIIDIQIKKNDITAYSFIYNEDQPSLVIAQLMESMSNFDVDFIMSFVRDNLSQLFTVSKSSSSDDGMVPFHYYKEYSEEDFKSLLKLSPYENKFALRKESIILENIISSLCLSVERFLLGEKNNGLLFQLIEKENHECIKLYRDFDIFSVSSFNELCRSISSSLEQKLNDEPLICIIPKYDFENYLKDYRKINNELPRKNIHGNYVTDDYDLRLVFHPKTFLATKKVVTSRSNLLLNFGDDIKLETEFHDTGKETYMFVRVEGSLNLKINI